ncbi:hypothetical protein CHU98_g6348 [Xylaria longipes]|nr:hypothetical protein CHU98_g6348 [Xylaria longipes]
MEPPTKALLTYAHSRVPQDPLEALRQLRVAARRLWSTSKVYKPTNQRDIGRNLQVCAPSEPTQQQSPESSLAAVPEHLIDNHHSTPKNLRIIMPDTMGEQPSPPPAVREKLEGSSTCPDNCSWNVDSMRTFVANTTSFCATAQIKSADMNEDMQQEVVDVAQEAMGKFTIEKDIAQHIKKTFDERKGPTWHCIVGRNFGSFVTHASVIRVGIGIGINTGNGQDKRT